MAKRKFDMKLLDSKRKRQTSSRKKKAVLPKEELELSELLVRFRDLFYCKNVNCQKKSSSFES